MTDEIPSLPKSISCAAEGGALHCLYINASGRILHSMRDSVGQWSGWGLVETPAGRDFVSADASCVGGELHVFVLDGEGLVFHNIRKADTTWQGFIELLDQPFQA